MKIQLVVASGVHQGKAIPVPNGKITIGRDPSCQLRPASPAVSKLHCTVQVRDGKVFVADHGSTNGTLLGEEPIQGEVEAPLGSRIRIGPLDFTIQPVAGSKPDNTPLPEALKSPAGVGKLAEAVGAKPSPAGKPGTPAPMTPAKPLPAVDAEKPTEVRPTPRKSAEVSEADALAALLLAEDEDSNPISVPDGSTVMEMAAVDADKLRAAGAAAAGGDKKKVASSQETSAAADEILKKYRRGAR